MAGEYTAVNAVRADPEAVLDFPSFLVRSRRREHSVPSALTQARIDSYTAGLVTRCWHAASSIEASPPRH